jgi:hypothetical protein
MLQNKQGHTRLTKWYIQSPDETDRLKMEADIHKVISLRDKKHTNFVEVCKLAALRRDDIARWDYMTTYNINTMICCATTV